MTQLGAKLKELRGDLFLYEVEKAIGIARTVLSRYERGKRTPEPQMLEKLARFYNASVTELKLLKFDDMFADPDELALILTWAKQKLEK